MNHKLITEIIQKALDQALTLKVSITVTVVDSSGRLCGMIRQENCSYFALDASLNKAITASQLKVPSHVVGELGEKFPALRNSFSKNPEINVLPGGFPILLDGRVVGGVGIAGGDFNEDQSIGKAAVRVSAT